MDNTPVYFYGGCLHGQVKHLQNVVKQYSLACGGEYVDYKGNRFIQLRDGIVRCARVFWVDFPPSLDDLKKSIPEHVWVVLDM